jgi:hypothetical protein
VPIRRLPQLPIARPTLERRFGLMAEGLRFETNDPALLDAAEASFGRFPLPPAGRDDLILRLFSESRPAEAGTPSSIVNRTHGPLYIVARGAGDIAVSDLEAGVAIGFVDTATAADMRAVRYGFIEAMALSMLSRARGYMAIHAAGVVRDGVGIVIQGPAGAGKSTLAIACARRGFGVLAEDVVFVRVTPSDIEFWGMPWTQRLLPDARAFFPELTSLEDRRQPNGEMKLEVDLDVAFPGLAVPTAAPGPIVLLERGTGGATRVEALDPEVEPLEVLWPWDGGWTADHERGSRRLTDRGLFRLHMNDSPDEAVDVLEALLDRLDLPAAAR